MVKFFDADPDPGSWSQNLFDPGSGLAKFASGINVAQGICCSGFGKFPGLHNLICRIRIYCPSFCHESGSTRTGIRPFHVKTVKYYFATKFPNQPENMHFSFTKVLINLLKNWRPFSITLPGTQIRISIWIHSFAFRNTGHITHLMWAFRLL